MPRLLSLALCLMPLVANAADDPVPIEQGPRHRLKFENEHVRFFDVELEPGYESRYHWHRSDGVFVTRIILHPGESTELYAPCGMLVSVSGGSIALDAPAGSERLDMPPAAFKWRQQGQVTKLVNTGKFVFHGVDIRLK